MFDLELHAYKEEGVKNAQGKPYTTVDFNFERNDKTVDLLMVDIKDKSILQVSKPQSRSYSCCCCVANISLAENMSGRCWIERRIKNLV